MSEYKDCSSHAKTPVHITQINPLVRAVCTLQKQDEEMKGGRGIAAMHFRRKRLFRSAAVCKKAGEPLSALYYSLSPLRNGQKFKKGRKRLNVRIDFRERAFFLFSPFLVCIRSSYSSRLKRGGLLAKDFFPLFFRARS